MNPDSLVDLHVIRDGASAWICVVTWPDGQKVTREVGDFHFAGIPAINVATTEEQALECLVRWVRERPQEWRR